MSGKIRRLKTLPVAPTIFTGGNLACGFAAIMCASHASQDNMQMFFYGGVLIFIAMLCDMFDGKVARMTKTDGPFGAELDSLADMVSFGVAPATLVHRIVLDEPGVWESDERLIMIISIFYAVFTAIRLARYNVEHHDNEAGEATNFFNGLPSPGAASVLCSWIILYGAGELNPIYSELFKTSLMGMTALCAVLMVSNIQFPHLGNTLLGQMSFRKFTILLLLVGTLIYFHWIGLAIITTLYAVIGLLAGILLSVRKWKSGQDILEETDESSI